MSKCARCVHKLETGDKFAVETLGDTDHRFYHQRCIKEDPDTKARAVNSPVLYVEYNQASKKY